MVFNRSKKWAIKPFKAIISNKKKYMSFTFNEFETKKVYIASGEKENVRLAVADFISDIKKACGTAETTSDIHKADIIVCSKESEELSLACGWCTLYPRRGVLLPSRARQNLPFRLG